MKKLRRVNTTYAMADGDIIYIRVWSEAFPLIRRIDILGPLGTAPSLALVCEVVGLWGLKLEDCTISDQSGRRADLQGWSGQTAVVFVRDTSTGASHD